MICKGCLFSQSRRDLFKHRLKTGKIHRAAVYILNRKMTGPDLPEQRKCAAEQLIFEFFQESQGCTVLRKPRTVDKAVGVDYPRRLSRIAVADNGNPLFREVQGIRLKQMIA